MILFANDLRDAWCQPVLGSTKNGMSTPSPRGQVAQWVDGLAAQGRSTFTTTDVQTEIGGTDAARKLALNRLVGRQIVFQPHHGFYVVVPAEYREVGAPPPLSYIDALMRFLLLPYYVGLLSAAAFYGAAHQAPQQFQVCTSRPIRRLTRGPAQIMWYVKHAVAASLVQERTTPNGYVLISSPDTTALDLVQYAHHAGHLSHVATVLNELRESLTYHEMLAALGANTAPATAQRLGFLLSSAADSRSPATDALEHWLSNTPHSTVPLQRGTSTAGYRLDRRWRVVVNSVIEPDGAA
jgi:predicted transcriptional regulator of viral defense system